MVTTTPATISSSDGYILNFTGDETTLEGVFGDKPIGPAEMTKRLWEHVRDHVWWEKLRDDDVSDIEAAQIVQAAAGRRQLPETEKEALVLSRRGQGRYRNDLIEVWGGQCAVTGCRETRVLRASHLKTWRSSTNKERLDAFNGLLLAPHLDALLDCGLITFEDDGRIRLSSRLASDDGRCLGIRSTMKLRKVDRPHVPYLRFHQAELFRK